MDGDTDELTLPLPVPLSVTVLLQVLDPVVLTDAVPDGEADAVAVGLVEVLGVAVAEGVPEVVRDTVPVTDEEPLKEGVTLELGDPETDWLPVPEALRVDDRVVEGVVVPDAVNEVDGVPLIE
jgi:hypothetical protein